MMKRHLRRRPLPTHRALRRARRRSPLAAAGCGPGAKGSGKKIIVGLITKTDTNPFFVKMKDGAQAEATAKGATLMAAAGTADGDVAARSRPSKT